ncbi:MAG: bifunctional hydroxymethylpyrimidine kinase/phosphomethylpyrimidine kinase [Thiotrichales bacterium 32-46-8]|nr:MAG: bifunctional hydroxymethylpyrimidine kinase/phosphomethylpyrimidine kinase [Thiotrichales bacterium 32-46-8]
MKYKALSIAGFDGSGGAGIQADLKTFSALECYGMNVLTALPVQNTCGVRNCYEIPLSSIREQLEAIFDDIIPDSIKIGMLFNSDIIEVVSNFLKINAKDIPIVLDPVMMAKNGNALLKIDSVTALKELLIPITTIITPNIPEALELTGIDTATYNNMPDIAHKLLALGPKAVLLKGGHLDEKTSNDLYLDCNKKTFWLESPRIDSRNVHGTGCTFSAAIAAYLAHKLELPEACKLAKTYLSGAIDAAKNEVIGKGYGSVHHFYNIW